MTLDLATCKERRSGRVYDPPDPENYFEMLAWPEYQKHLNWLMKAKKEEGSQWSSLKVLDGTADVVENAKIIASDLMKVAISTKRQKTKMNREGDAEVEEDS